MQTALQCKASIQDILLSMDRVTYLKDAEIEIDMNLLADLDNYKFTFDENRLRLNAIEDGPRRLGSIARRRYSNGYKSFYAQNQLQGYFIDDSGHLPKNLSDLQTSGNVSLKAEAKGRLDEKRYRHLPSPSTSTKPKFSIRVCHVRSTT